MLKRSLIKFPIIFFLISFFITAYGGEKDIGMNKLNQALSQMTKKNYSKALDLFLDCFDNAHKYEPSFMDIKNSFLIIYLEKMLKNYPPTKNALESRYLAMRKKVESGNFLKSEISSVYELAKLLGRKDEMIVLYDFAKKNIKKKPKLEFITGLFYPELYKKKRYRDIYENWNPVKSAKSLVKKFSNEKGVLGEYAEKFVVDRLNEYKTIFIKVKDKNKEKEIDLILKRYKSSLKNIL